MRYVCAPIVLLLASVVANEETFEMLQAMNTGHDGSMSTLHANSPRDAISRLESMVMMCGMNMPLDTIRRNIASAVNMIIQVSRMNDGSRKVVNITEIMGIEGDKVIMQDIFSFHMAKQRDAEGHITGQFQNHGLLTRSAVRNNAPMFNLEEELKEIFGIYGGSMMYLAIAIIGCLLLFITVHSWLKLKRSIRNHRKPVRSLRISDTRHIAEIFIEWFSYVRGNNNKQQINSIMFSLAFFTMVIFANYEYGHLNWPMTLTAASIVLFTFQLLRGRSAKYAMFEQSFPEAIAIVTSGVASGATVLYAIERCGLEIHTPLGHEFYRISRRINLGENPEVVFNDAWRRFYYPEFYIFSVVILLSLQRGGQLTELMKRLGRMIAAHKNMIRRKAALTSEVRMSAKIIAAIPIAFIFLMKFISPDNFDFLFNDSRGHFPALLCYR